MWNSIITSFYRTSKEIAATVRVKLFAMKYAGNSLLSLKEFLQEFAKNVQMLKNLGRKLTDEDLMCRLLHVLPPEFAPIKLSTLDNRNFTKMTWESLVANLTAFGKEIFRNGAEAENREVDLTQCGSVSSFQVITRNRGRSNIKEN